LFCFRGSRSASASEKQTCTRGRAPRRCPIGTTRTHGNHVLSALGDTLFTFLALGQPPQARPARVLAPVLLLSELEPISTRYSFCRQYQGWDGGMGKGRLFHPPRLCCVFRRCLGGEKEKRKWKKSTERTVFPGGILDIKEIDMHVSIRRLSAGQWASGCCLCCLRLAHATRAYIPSHPCTHAVPSLQTDRRDRPVAKWPPVESAGPLEGLGTEANARAADGPSRLNVWMARGGPSSASSTH